MEQAEEGDPGRPPPVSPRRGRPEVKKDLRLANIKAIRTGDHTRIIIKGEGNLKLCWTFSVASIACTFHMSANETVSAEEPVLANEWMSTNKAMSANELMSANEPFSERMDTNERTDVSE